MAVTVALAVVKVIVPKKINIWVLLQVILTLSITNNLTAQAPNIDLIQKKTVTKSHLKTTVSTCPSSPVSLVVQDSTNFVNGTGSTLPSGTILNCGYQPIYIKAANVSPITTPCVESYFTSSDITLPNNGTETFYEGSNNVLCVGPSSSCVYPIGGGGGFTPIIGSSWSVDKIWLDPNQQHNFEFCYQGPLPLAQTNVQLLDCWSETALSPVRSFSLITLGGGCFSDSLLAHTDIGIATYSIAPASGTVALTDYHNGKCLLQPDMLPSGSYTLTYNFQPSVNSGCSAVSGTFKFIIAPITISVNSATICAGGTATLTANGATTYSWTPSVGLSSTIGSTVTASPSGSAAIYTVTGINGTCSGTATSTITINAAPIVTVNSPSICAGNSATLTATGATSYTWMPSAGLSATTGSVVIATPGTTTASYTVTGKTGGCSASAISNITVTSTPTINVNSASICAGSSATLTANGANSYSWAPSTGLSTTTGSIVVASPTAPITYTVTGTSLTCSSVKTASVVVNPSPTLTVNSASVCTGASATLTAGGANTYSWSTSITGASITVSPTITTTYTVTGTNSSGCKNLSVATVTVNSLPNVTVNTATVCAGSTTTLTAAGAVSYTWNTGTNGATITASPTLTTTYTVTGTDIHNCKNATTSTITVNQIPNVSVNSLAICIGKSATLSASGAATYTWSTGIISANITTSPTVATTYTVIGTNNSGCKNFSVASVTVNPLPNVTVNSPTVCAGNSTTLTANGASTYTWSTSSTGVSITITPTVSSTYSVSGTNANGCINSSVSHVHVSALPVVSPSVSAAVCIGQSIQFKANTISGSSVYLWSGPNGYVSSLQNPSITNANALSAGIYTLSITTAGCASSNTVGVVVDALPSLASAGRDTILYGNSLLLTGNVPFIGTGTWSIISGSGNFTNSNQANTQVSNLQSGQNILQWTISNGACPASSDELIIFVKDLIIPNGFSPNGDGVNDFFEIKGLEEYTNVKINIFNRWGNLVYDSNDYKNNWDGKNKSGEDVSDDTYFFTVTIPNKNNLKGYVVLKRK